ncbi:MAG: hypothetical protein AB7O68_16910 [Pirellulales bacterium]
MVRRLAIIGGCILLVAVLVLFRNAFVEYDRARPVSPVDAVPDVAGMARSFRQAKDDCEARARFMLSKRLRFRRRDSRELYTEARIAHNGAIAFVCAVLVAPAGTYTEEQIQFELTNADAKRQAFTGEYKAECAAGADDWGAAAKTGPASLCEPLIGMWEKLLMLTDDANREASRQLREQIKEYEMVDWTSL